MTKRKIDTHLKRVVPFVHDLKRAAYAEGFRAGAEAMKKLVKSIYKQWAYDPNDNRLFDEMVDELPLPEMKT